MREECHRVDAVRQGADVPPSRSRGESVRLHGVRNVADEDGDRRRRQDGPVDGVRRESENSPTQGVDQQQLNEVVDRQAKEAVDVSADDPRHAEETSATRAGWRAAARVAAS
jgi:hypothetical protein